MGDTKWSFNSILFLFWVEITPLPLLHKALLHTYYLVSKKSANAVVLYFTHTRVKKVGKCGGPLLHTYVLVSKKQANVLVLFFTHTRIKKVSKCGGTLILHTQKGKKSRQMRWYFTSYIEGSKKQANAVVLYFIHRRVKKVGKFVGILLHTYWSKKSWQIR